jgi:hypothetical protein
MGLNHCHATGFNKQHTPRLTREGEMANPVSPLFSEIPTMTTFAAVPLMLEKVLPRAIEAFPHENSLWDLFKARPVEKVSGRAYKIPQIVLNGGQSQVFDPAGGSMPRGSAVTAAAGTASACFTVTAREITLADMYGTDSTEKAIENFLTKNVSGGLKQHYEYQDALIAGDGSGTHGTVTVVAGTTLTVDNASMFSDLQIVDVWSALGGTYRGALQIAGVDFVNNKIVIAAVPDARQTGVVAIAGLTTGLAVNDLLLSHGASGAADTFVRGLKYHNSNSSAASWQGLTPSNYPGKLVTPYINAGAAALSRSMIRLMEDLLSRAHGIGNEELDKLVAIVPLDQRAAWGAIGTALDTSIFQMTPGDSSLDPLKKRQVQTMAGRKMVASNRATKQRIDFVIPDHFGRGEILPTGPFAPFGQSSFMPVGANGMPVNAVDYLWVSGYNIHADSRNSGAYVDGLASVAGY